MRSADAAHLTPTHRWPLPYAALTLALFAEQSIRQDHLTPVYDVVLVLVCLPLAWQRDHPFEALTGAFASFAAIAAQGLDTTSMTAAFFLVFGPVFCVARFEPRRRAVAGFVVASGLLVLGGAVNSPPNPGVVAVIPLFVAPAWAIGRLIRSRSELVAELAGVNDEIDRERGQREAAAAADERARVARELHDVVAHALSVMVIQAAGARLAVSRAPAASEQALTVVANSGEQAIVEMQRLLGVLGGDAPGSTAGLARLGEVVERARSAGLAVEVSLDPAIGTIAPTVDLAAFRIAQEAITNAVKHAAPTGARVRVTVDATAVEVLVEDDGRPGGERSGPGTGHGLLGIRERAELHGGSVDAGPRPGGGFRVRARLPVE